MGNFKSKFRFLLSVNIKQRKLVINKLVMLQNPLGITFYRFMSTQATIVKSWYGRIVSNINGRPAEASTLHVQY